MTLTIKKHDKEELQTLIGFEMQAYAMAVQGRDSFVDGYGRLQTGEFNQYGAVEVVQASFPQAAMKEVQGKLDQGYKLYTGSIYEPSIGKNLVKIYVVKPDALQAEDAKAIAAEVAAKYEADIDAHNNKVFEQERAAMLIEEEEVRKAVLAEEARKVEADVEKRVQQRLRGMRGAK